MVLKYTNRCFTGQDFQEREKETERNNFIKDQREGYPKGAVGIKMIIKNINNFTTMNLKIQVKGGNFYRNATFQNGLRRHRYTNSPICLNQIQLII